jgi:hypothetical protein
MQAPTEREDIYLRKAASSTMLLRRRKRGIDVSMVETLVVEV